MPGPSTMPQPRLETPPPANPPWLRAILAAPLAWTTFHLSAGARGCFLDLVNLAFHEAGHLFLAPFGTTLHVLGGTLGQLAVPAAFSVYFFRARRDRFAAAACLWWTGENLVNVAVYMADARDLALPLVGGGEHDWNTLFYDFGLLGPDSVAAIAGVTRALGLLGMWGALLGMAMPLAVGFRRARPGAATGQLEENRGGENPGGGQPSHRVPQPASGSRRAA